MKVINLLHFCKTKQGEIGIADGYFAGDAWKYGDKSFAEVAGRKFGWIDSEGKNYCDPREFFSRPTEAEVIQALQAHEALNRIAKQRVIAE